MTKLVAIEGVDAVGKSTQCKLLQAMLDASGYKTRVEGLRSLTGFDAALDDYRSGSNEATRELDFFLRFWIRYIDEIVLVELNLSSGVDILITDRYVGSFLAYQSYTSETAAQIAFEALSLRAPVPEVTILLSAGSNGPWTRALESPEVGDLERSLNSTIRQEHARNSLLKMASERGWQKVASDRDRGTISAEIFRCLRSKDVIL